MGCSALEAAAYGGYHGVMLLLLLGRWAVRFDGCI